VEQVRYEKAGRVATVTMDRARYRNAQSRLLREELDQAFAEAVADDDVRVIVLRGAGDHFSSGHDLGTPEELADQEARPYADGALGVYERSWNQNVENSLRWRELPKPTIAAVQGFCIYGGWIIASAMDLIVAADDARFLPAHFQYFSVPWDVGPRRTKEILWLADFVTADDALDLGFVNRVVPRADLEAETTQLAERIAGADPLVARFIKQSVNQAQDAMGFRTSVIAAHNAYMVMQMGGKVRAPGDARKRLPGVERSLRQTET
jgi:enoyl-CoA hydratase